MQHINIFSSYFYPYCFLKHWKTACRWSRLHPCDSFVSIGCKGSHDSRHALIRFKLFQHLNSMTLKDICIYLKVLHTHTVMLLCKLSTNRRSWAAVVEEGSLLTGLFPGFLWSRRGQSLNSPTSCHRLCPPDAQRSASRWCCPWRLFHKMQNLVDRNDTKTQFRCQKT